MESVPVNILRVCIYDDERYWCQQMAKVVRDFFSNRYVIDIQFPTDSEGVLSTEADIILLDIRLNEGTGFSIADKLGRRKRGLVIFCTAYEEYMFEAFSFQPFRFVRKLYLKNDLTQAMKAAEDYISDRSETFWIKSGEAVRVLHKNEILYIEKVNRKCIIHTSDKEQIEVRETIRDLMDRINSNKFVMAHRWLIVNLRQVVGYDRTCVFLANSERIIVSRTAMQTIRRSLLESGGDGR